MIPAKLSSQQVDILIGVYRRIVWIEKVAEANGGYFFNAHDWRGTSDLPTAARWVSGKDCKFTRSEQASMSRALRRLEHRGLVERGNHISGSRNYTTSVSLTNEGRHVASALCDREWGEGWEETVNV